ncbi:heme exporter protein CcmD [Beijerinckia mobilis]|uniref:heme exporter protein CcmD n=1 Tax=Beijerinckia mobilis TaxID=231434 RepID=UPI000554C563|nr:heme exporter protein CcmD [Beijerinckia mobilis]
MMQDPNLSYVFAAYGIGCLIILGMIFAVWRDYRNLRRQLAIFGAGTERRSGHGSGRDQGSH